MAGLIIKSKESVDLKGKVAVVSAASSGLGKAVTELLSKEDVKVFALARSIDSIALPANVVKIPVNISELDEIETAFTTIDKRTDKIDIFVNCAGRGLIKQLENTAREEIVNVLEVNLLGNISVAQQVYKRMLPQKSGHIVNIISTSGLKSRADETIYCASKWGLRGFTESLRLAAAAHKIRVTGIFPGEMSINTSKYMDPLDIAKQVFNILKTPLSLAPSELVLERGF